MTTQELVTLAGQVIELSRKTGRFQLDEMAHFKRDSIEYKGLHDLVSYVDRESETALVNGLSQLLPAAGFLTEEGMVSQEAKPWRWIIDPLDGTTNFIHGLPFFAISIALVYDDVLQLGVVYEVSRGECFWAVKGHGAYLHQQKLQVSSVPLLNESLLATGFPYYNFDKMPAYLAVLRECMQGSQGMRRLGSAALDLAYVAAGRFDAYFEYNLKPWDVAAGALLVQEAGGVVTDFSGGNKYLYGHEIAASNPSIYPELMAILSRQFNS
jgi:myo-inositol-1(or 4)-monophosphatase